jgi:ABC-type Fe3+ transport system substrate-binding protein
VRSHKVAFDQVSRDPFKGISFLYMGNVKELLYNPKAIAPAELPKTHAELVQAKYAGKFTQPPWTSHWEVAPQILKDQGREKFLDVVRAAGKNTGAVLNENTGVERVVLGQYAFALAQDTYLRQTLAKDAQAPLAGVFFRDYNELNSVYYSVRTKAPHPAAATLWAMWMTTPEAEAIWQPVVFCFVPYGSSAIDAGERAAFKASGAPVIGYLDNPQTIALLRWQQSPEGTQFLAAVAKAIRGE